MHSGPVSVAAAQCLRNIERTYEIMPGPVSRCGIPMMKDLGAIALQLARLHGLPPEAAIHQNFLQEHEVMEIAVRIGLRQELEEVYSEMPESWFASVHQVWFDTTYPTPPRAV